MFLKKINNILQQFNFIYAVWWVGENLSSHIFKYKTKYELLHIFTDKNFLSLEVAHFTDSFFGKVQLFTYFAI